MVSRLNDDTESFSFAIVLWIFPPSLEHPQHDRDEKASYYVSLKNVKVLVLN